MASFLLTLLRLGWGALWRGALVVATLWAIGAIYYDLPFAALRLPLAIAYGLLIFSTMILSRRGRLVALVAFFVVLLPWLQIKPEARDDWQPDVGRTAYAEINGDLVTFHNVRHCDYRTELDYTANWGTRTVDLNKVRGIDLAINYWGSPAIAHPIVSFQIEGEEPLSLSIETRKHTGQTYSTIAGFYRQYELIYIVSDERDLIRVRTNYRHGETVFLYRTRTTPHRAKEILLSYIERLNELHKEPEFYNAVTSNCTTNIRVHTVATAKHPDPWDWRILLNGYLDEMLYEKGALVGEGPFAALKKRSEVKAAAEKIGDAPDFSAQIRKAIALPPDPIFVAADDENTRDIVLPK